jgi:hypothetical protein
METELDIIAAWMQDVLGSSVTVVIAPTNASSPAGPYVAIQTLSDHLNASPVVFRERVPVEDIEDTEDDTDEIKSRLAFTAMELARHTVSVNAFANNAQEILNRLKLATALPYEDKPYCVDFGDIRDLSFINDSNFAGRAQCEMTFAFSRSFGNEDEAVDDIEIKGTFADMDSSAATDEDKEPEAPPVGD